MTASKLDRYLTKAEVLKREYWTTKTMEEFLPVPDKTASNPKFKSAAPMKLYLESKIIEVEGSVAFIMNRDKVIIRKQRALKAKETKHKKILEWVDSLKIEVPVFSKTELYEKACIHYNQFKKRRASEKKERLESWYTRRGYEEVSFSDIEEEIEDLLNFDEATLKSRATFLNRIATNYIRHQLTSYESELSKLFGKVGRDIAYQKLKDKVNASIYTQYEFLVPADDVVRQLDKQAVL